MEEKKPQALIAVLENLKKKIGKKDAPLYRVPSLWIKAGEKSPEEAGITAVNPYDYLKSHIEAIIEYGRAHREQSLHYKGSKGFWIDEAQVYNIFPRLASAFDHDGDGVLGGQKNDITLNGQGIRETGTFLKTLAMLGHISSLGCNAVYFLPITSIGKFGNKGDLGSPYAIKDPYQMDERLCDPLCDLDLTTQFRALVEACHILGMKVILEFVFRTAAKDSDWIPAFPDWFYWIDNSIPERSSSMTPEEMKNSYGNPIFEESDLTVIKEMVRAKNFTGLPEPPENYRQMFKLSPPDSTKIKKDKSGQFIGDSMDPRNGRKVKTRIPGAFADWPPDDTQPPWTDVTYLRIYRDEDPGHPRFNYIGYNTIRMYDTALAREDLANRPLWDKISHIIPHYQETFGVNGVMVDMGHAIPPALMQEIMKKARDIDPDFAFLSENFTVDRHSLEAGYNLVLGYAWKEEHTREGMMKLLRHAGIEGMPLSFFATAESHNTPRSIARAGIEYSKSAYLVNCFVPHGVPFIHNGYELAESHAVNTGLDFTAEELEYYRDRPLALFDRFAFDWTRKEHITSYIARVNELRNAYREVVFQKSAESFALLETGNEHVVAFARRGAMEGRGTTLYVIVNCDYRNPQHFTLQGEHYCSDRAENLVDGTVIPVRDGALAGVLSPGEGCLFVQQEAHVRA